MSAFCRPISYNRRIRSHLSASRRSASLPACCTAQFASTTIAEGSRLARSPVSSAAKSNSLHNEKATVLLARIGIAADGLQLLVEELGLARPIYELFDVGKT